MTLLDNIASGFATAFTFEALLYCFIGVTLGTLVGVLPGIGALAAISMLLPISFYLEPTHALILLAGIFYGSQYGGSTASILLNLPGTATNAVTCIDGYPMTKQGRGGIALFVTTITSFIGGSFSIILLMAFAPFLASVALSFSAAEYFSMMLLGLVAASTLSEGSPLKGFAMVILGMILGIVGSDINSGQYRFTFGSLELTDGLSLVAVAMGLFGVSEILSNLKGKEEHVVPVKSVSLRSMIPTREDVRRSFWPTVRGSGLGAAFGILPGTGATIASFISYAVEKRVSREPERFGKGAIEGIASPEAANNAAVQAAFIPTFSLGIPGDAVMAVMIGALMIHGITPGPQLVSNQPDLFWGLVASFWIGNVLLLILNIPLIGIWVRLISIPYRILFPAMLFFICIGVFSIRNSIFDVYLVIGFGLFGYVLKILGFSAAPLLLGFILGPLVEQYLRRALLIAQGDLTVFVKRPVSAAFLAVSVLLIAWTLVPMIRKLMARRRERLRSGQGA